MAKFKVLFIDDEEELVSALVERLEYRDIDSEYTLTGPDGLRKLQEDSFDIVLLDLKLPGMSGTEVLAEIKNKYPDIPVLMITGHGAAVDEQHSIPIGAFDLLVKPIELEDLII